MLFPNFQAHSDLGPGLCGMGSSATHMFDTRRKLHETQRPCYFSKTSNIKTTMSRWPLWPELQQGLGEFLSRSHNWWDTNHCCVTRCCMVCHGMTRLQLCLFSRKGGSAAPHGETPYPCGPRLKWLEMGDELVKAEVEKTIHPVLYICLYLLQSTSMWWST